MARTSGVPAQPGGARPRVADLAVGPPAVPRGERVAVLGAGRAAVQVLDILSRCPQQLAVALFDEATGTSRKKLRSSHA